MQRMLESCLISVVFTQVCKLDVGTSTRQVYCHSAIEKCLTCTRVSRTFALSAC
jgi:hypothetical protein